MRIAICDDDLKFLAGITQKLAAHPLITRADSYSKTEDLISDIQSGEIFDLVMMDLAWDRQETGFDYARRLYQTAPYLPVIYVTGFNDRFAPRVLLHDSNLAGYLTKPVDDELLDRYLNKIQNNRNTNRSFSFLMQGHLISLDTQRILYLESQNHNSFIHADTVSYKVHERLNGLLSRLPDSFVQCHKSYIVNMSWIQRMEPNKLILKDGRSVPISRSCLAQTRSSVFSFLGLQV